MSVWHQATASSYTPGLAKIDPFFTPLKDFKRTSAICVFPAVESA